MADKKSPPSVFHFPAKNANSKTEARPGARVKEQAPTVPLIKPTTGRPAPSKPVRTPNVIDTAKNSK